MTILFHPHYDARCHLDPGVHGSVQLDTLIIGPLGLLQELELRLGLTTTGASTLMRTVNYMTLLRNYFTKHPDSPFAESFRADEYNVAAELLRWRDLLRLAGWDSSMRSISRRIDLLADLEAGFALPALGDRWQAVMKNLSNHDLKGWTIKLQCPKRLLFPLYDRLFERLSESGAKILEPGNEPTYPGKVYRIRARDLTEAFRAIPTLDPKQWTLICNHGKLLNNVLRLNGCPTTESSIRENDSSIVQLFESGFSLFIHPSDELPDAVDIYRLLNYLQARPNPIPSRVNLALQRLLISEAGINPVCWQAAIDEALAAGDNPDRDRRLVERLLQPFFAPIPAREIPLDLLKAYARSLRGWAMQRHHLSAEMAESLPLLTEMCDVMLAMLESYSEETIDGRLLQGWISSIRTDATIRNTEAQVGSFDVVEHPAALVDPVDRAVWIDCAGMPDLHYDFEFLGPDERRNLERHGVKVWSRTEEMKAELELLRRGVGQVHKELILITPESDRGESLEPHPIVGELKYEEREPFFLPTAKETACRPKICTKQAEYHLSSGRITPREKESYSSLDLLIQRPFDYVMQYAARLRSGGLGELDELDRIEGNVAHRTLELIARVANNNRNVMSQIIDSQEKFDRYFLDAMRQCGMGLLLTQHTIERKALQERLRNALSNLMQILIHYNLQVEGLEMEASTPLLADNGPVLAARVDLLLRNAKGDPVIFDLKWSHSEKRYETLIREGRDMQLRIYDCAVSGDRKRPVAATGYFLLARGTLLTSQLPATSNYVRQVNAPLTTDKIMDRIRAGYVRRYDELHKGIIEEGEGLPVDQLPYAQSGDPETLWPLVTEQNKGQLKQIAPYDNAFRIFKGTLK